MTDVVLQRGRERCPRRRQARVLSGALGRIARDVRRLHLLGPAADSPLAPYQPEGIALAGPLLQA